MHGSVWWQPEPESRSEPGLVVTTLWFARNEILLNLECELWAGERQRETERAEAERDRERQRETERDSETRERRGETERDRERQ